MSRKAKYSPKEAEDIAHWIEEILAEKLPGHDDPILALKDGVILCKLVNTIKPGIAKYKQSNMPFVQMENIAAFLRAAESIGVAQHELFETVDLYEMRDPVQVTITLRSLSRHANVLNPTLPVIGPKLQGSKTPDIGVVASPRLQDRSVSPARRDPTPERTTASSPVPKPVSADKSLEVAEESPVTDTKRWNPQAQSSPRPRFSPTPERTTALSPVPKPVSADSSLDATEESPVADTNRWNSHAQSSPRPRFSPTPVKSTMPTLSIDLDNSPLVKPDSSLLSEGDSSSILAEDRDTVTPFARSPDFQKHEQRNEGSPRHSRFSPPLQPSYPAYSSKPSSQSPARVPVGARHSPAPRSDQSPTRFTNNVAQHSSSNPAELPQAQGTQGQHIGLRIRPPKPKGPRTYVPSPNLRGSSVFGNNDEDDEDEDSPSAPYQSYGRNYKGKIKNSKEIEKHRLPDKLNRQLIDYDNDSLNEKAEDYDSSVYGYDEVYDTMKNAEREAHKGSELDSGSRKSRYITNLLDSKSQRDRDRQIAHDRMLAREREVEGTELKDKERFVTSAYKLQQQEALRQTKLEEELAPKAKSGSINNFHRALLDNDDQVRSKIVEAVKRKPTAPGSAVETSTRLPEEESLTARARRINDEAGYEKVMINDSGELVDNRQLLDAGLNILGKKAKGPRDPRSSSQSSYQKQHSGGSFASQKGVARRDGRSDRKRETEQFVRQLEEQQDEQTRAKEERQHELKEALKSKQIDDQAISSARQRYLARKKAAEASRKDSLVHKS